MYIMTHFLEQVVRAMVRYESGTLAATLAGTGISHIPCSASICRKDIYSMLRLRSWQNKLAARPRRWGTG